jgi:4-amino-4-deoxy-L-arabinose transferase-like glycosyltransferase
LVRRIREGLARERAGAILLACWIGVYVVFWSLVSTKFPHYVLPCYPALALATAALIDRWLAEPARAKAWWMRNACIIFVVAGLAIAVAIPLVAQKLLPGEDLLGLVGLILVAGAAPCYWLARRGRPDRALAAFAIVSGVFVVAIFGFAVLRVDRHQNAPTLMAQIRADCQGEPDVATYRVFRYSFVYYAGRPIDVCEKAESLRQFLATARQPYVLTTDETEAEVCGLMPGRFEVARRAPWSLKRQALVVLKCRPEVARRPPSLAR